MERPCKGSLRPLALYVGSKLVPTYPEVGTSSVTALLPAMRPWLHGYEQSEIANGIQLIGDPHPQIPHVGEIRLSPLAG